MAPNLLTFIGFAFMVSSCAIQLYYDTTLTQDIPRWSYLFSAINAIDGKQARRTCSSSPLGQLFDHGCDSFGLTFFLLGAASAARIDKEYIFYIFLGLQIVLWGTNQKEHQTGILHTHVYNVGVTEVELLAVFIHLVAFFFGQDGWHTTINQTLPQFLRTDSIPYLSLFMNTPCYQIVISVFTPVSFLVGGLFFFQNIFSSSDKLRTFMEWINLIFFWGLQFIWFRLPIYAELAGPVILTFGIIASLIVCKLIITSTTKDVTTLFHIEAIPFEFITLIIYYQQNLSPETIKYLFWFNFIVTLLLVIRFLRSVVLQITSFLGIYCFSLERRHTS